MGRFNMVFSEADADIKAHLEKLNIPKAAYIKLLIRRDMYSNGQMDHTPVEMVPALNKIESSTAEKAPEQKPKATLDFGGMEF